VALGGCNQLVASLHSQPETSPQEAQPGGGHLVRRTLPLSVRVHSAPHLPQPAPPAAWRGFSTAHQGEPPTPAPVPPPITRPQALLLQGMLPASDAAAPPPPPAYCAVQLDGRVVGYASEAAAEGIVARLRTLKAAAYSDSVGVSGGGGGGLRHGGGGCATAVSTGLGAARGALGGQGGLPGDAALWQPTPNASCLPLTIPCSTTTPQHLPPPLHPCIPRFNLCTPPPSHPCTPSRPPPPPTPRPHANPQSPKPPTLYLKTPQP
jgi:hypothetical protein